MAFTRQNQGMFAKFTRMLFRNRIGSIENSLRHVKHERERDRPWAKTNSSFRIAKWQAGNARPTRLRTDDQSASPTTGLYFTLHFKWSDVDHGCDQLDDRTYCGMHDSTICRRASVRFFVVPPKTAQEWKVNKWEPRKEPIHTPSLGRRWNTS